MKIKTKALSYDQVMALPKGKRRQPRRPSRLLNLVVQAAATPDLLATKFSYTKEGMEKLGKQPALILMNHSCFLDLMIAARVFFPRRYSIVCTSDGLIGKNLLMHFLGCISTQKFVSDVTLIRDMEYMLKEKKTSVLMYPEASYSFDGTATPLPGKWVCC